MKATAGLDLPPPSPLASLGLARQTAQERWS